MAIPEAAQTHQAERLDRGLTDGGVLGQGAGADVVDASAIVISFGEIMSTTKLMTVIHWRAVEHIGCWGFGLGRNRGALLPLILGPGSVGTPPR